MRNWAETVVVLSEEEHIAHKMGRDNDLERRSCLDIGVAQSVRN